MDISNPLKKRTILVFAANPKDTERLRLDEEVKAIDEGLRRGQHRDSFRIAQKWAVTHEDLRRGLLDEEPEIVHFSGHGSDSEGLFVEDKSGKKQSVARSALAELFALFTKHVKCV